MDIKLLKFNPRGDNRGQLIPIESDKDIPFAIKRVYYIYDTAEGVIRGRHAHKSLEQVLICVTGSCKVSLDDGKSKEEICLNKPNEGIYIKNNIWREMYDFSNDAVLVVLASDYYDENDYIRDYNEFIDYIRYRK